MVLLLKKIEVVEKIKEYIIKESLKPNDKLPSERKLSDMWGINRKTLREGMDILIKEDYLYKKRGSGAYIKEEKLKRNLWEFSSFTEAMENNDYEVSTKVISIESLEATKEFARSLKITLGTKLIKIKRLRIVNGEPIALETSIIPYKYCEGIEKYNLEKKSLYSILEEEYNIQLASQTHEISIVDLKEQEKNCLEVDDSSALTLSGVTFDVSNKPIEYCESITRGDRCKFTSILR